MVGQENRKAGIMISGDGIRIFLKIRKNRDMVSRCGEKDFAVIHQVINDGASAYKGIIPADRWNEPYMSKEELQTQIDEGVEFWKFLDGGEVVGVMGIQFKGDVTLIRHAYVRSSERKKGIGSKLLEHLRFD